MSNQADATRATVRQAEEPDIPAILSLVLTSYRQFPLFNYLYSPLEYDKDAAHDTVFFWHRRVLLDLLNPTVMILVAEVPTTLSPTNASPGDGADPVELESWRMLEWVLRNRKLSQASNKMPGSVVAGFAIWKDRLGGRAGPSEKAAVQKTNWINSLRVTLLNLENSFWSMVYQRRDQHPTRYHEYIKAEETLEERYYQERCYYLDNLCVDFRYQRLGIGRLLLDWGINIARQRKHSIGTEASVKGVGLYRKMGFEQVGLWKIADIEIPVMKLATP
ncbi:hypothetical protein MMC21_000477 [Puttea exsequens]|nr:hypothetical protein [Puttea exsequens]